VLAAPAERLTRDAIVVEETPSSRAGLHARIPARAPLGFPSAAIVDLANGGYAITDRLTASAGGEPGWPASSVDVVGVATSLGCPAHRIETHDELLRAFDAAVPSLARRGEPLLLEVAVGV
jgi:benzoylformate decarboxylase